MSSSTCRDLPPPAEATRAPGLADDGRYGNAMLERLAWELALAGDRSACAFLFARYADEVHEHCRELIGKDDLAARLTQLAFHSLGDGGWRGRRGGIAVLFDEVQRLIGYS